MSINMNDFSKKNTAEDNADLRKQVLAKNLTHLMKQKSVDTKELAKTTGISATNINNLKKGATNPTLSTIEILADYFSVPLTKLISDNLSTNTQDSEFILKELPLLTIDEISDFSANNTLATQKTRATTIEFTSKDQNRFIILINNNSMAPLYEKGTIFVINSDLNFTDGDMVLCKAKNGFSSIRKIYIAGEKTILNHPTINDSTTTVKTEDLIIHGVIEKIVQEP